MANSSAADAVISFLVSLVSYSAVIFALIYLYFWYSFGYWKRRGVPEIEAVFPLGSTKVVTTGLNLGAVTADFYKEFKKRNCRYGGVYAGPSPKLVLLDLELIKQIFTKDFPYFTGRGNYVNEKHQPITAHLFNLEGKRWKNLRTKLTPTFTSGKMKIMFNTLVECSENMIAALSGKKDDILVVKDVCARFTTDVIGSCALGIECNSFKYPDAEFRVIGKKALQPGAMLDKIRKFFTLAFPETSKTLGNFAIYLLLLYCGFSYLQLEFAETEYKRQERFLIIITIDSILILLHFRFDKSSKGSRVVLQSCGQ